MSSDEPQNGTSNATLTAAHWGTYRVVFDKGDPVRVEGLAADPAPSAIGMSMLKMRTSPLRVTQPAVRRAFLEDGPNAARDERGRDSFVAVSWDTALDLVARELERVRSAHGHEAIFAGSYGWASAGRFHHAQSQLKRFFRMFGGATFSRDSYSYAAGEVILPHIVAPMQKLLLEHTSWKAVAEGTRLVVAFGGIAIRNAQVEAGGLGGHTQSQDMRAARKAGVSFVNVSPDASDMMPELEAEWLGLRPGTDLALMLGIAHTLHAEGLHDTEFLEKYCTGFERFLPYLTGSGDGQPKDPDWAATITGIGSGSIRALARRMAAESTIINASWSLTRQENGEQIYWMLVVLAAMLGGIGRSGQGFAFGLGAVNGIGKHRAHLHWASLPAGDQPNDNFIPVARIADMLLNPGTEYRYDGQIRRYPDIRLVYWAGGNPFHHHQDLNRLRAAWSRIETVIVHEQVWTATARQADIVLPITMGLERNDICGSQRDDHMIFSAKICPPHGAARNDHDVFAQLSRRLRPSNSNDIGFELTFTESRDEAAWLAALYETTRERGQSLGHNLPTYDAFRKAGILRLSEPLTSRTTLQEFLKDPNLNPLPTPSGLIEIFSDTIAGFGLANLPGHPVWTAPAEWLGVETAKDWPLHLITHQPANKLHSQMDHAPHSLASKIGGREPCHIHPADAAKREIKNGDAVRIVNARGACFAVARLDDAVLPGVVKMATGAWYDPDWDNDPSCCRHGNPNVLTSDRPTSELAQGPAALGCLVEISRCDDPPAVRAFDPPQLIRDPGKGSCA